ncbi:glycoside hydrolase family 13 protein [Actinomadura sp. DC4]|uniref:glycoside hydrolase family 13 protein n=1 Tax=Actinomadura sp. DC4 TaxID=3055069 RepID=UPI0025B1C5E7|nr:glycoside hydrolase family 13 protein [Actinomadura sp. DC4]MDN3354986.1 glycoside hydrolase family 13 protein [Actinomadura sp. DC4]
MRETWWRGAAIYQVYLRSFADGNGDGLGDLAGLRSRLAYLSDLGIDAIWLNPWYPSPMSDGGYDVADYRSIEPVFGTLAEAEKLIQEAHDLNIKIIIDVVPNHSSDQNAWFQEALAAGPGSAARERFWFRPGKDGGPPNDWQSIFGGPAWTQVADGEWYLHLFAPEQPDFNWNSDAVREEFLDVLRFWFDRGVDGIRIDSAAVLIKDPDAEPDGLDPYTDRDGVHEIYREWRQVSDTYPGRFLIGEVWLPDQERFARYLRPDELHTAFNFDFLACPWDASALRRVIDTTLATHVPIGAPPTWVLSNHDVTRPVTRYGRPDTSFAHDDRKHGMVSDRDLGIRRARAAALLAMALPGGVYVYQGEELGLPEVEDIPDNLLQDPIWARSGNTDRGRDGCRVPVPWSGDAPPYGYGGEPWLPQPADWGPLTVEAQEPDATSMLNLYRTALRIRHEKLGDGTITWVPLGDEVLAFTRESGLTCVVNLGTEPVRLPEHQQICLASGPVDGGLLPADTAVWLL